MDEVIFEEFKGTGNSEIVLDRKLADKRDLAGAWISASPAPARRSCWSTRAPCPRCGCCSRILMPMGVSDSVDFLVDKLKSHKTNSDFFDAMNQ